jgi:hypothetical protein
LNPFPNPTPPHLITCFHTKQYDNKNVDKEKVAIWIASANIDTEIDGDVHKTPGTGQATVSAALYMYTDDRPYDIFIVLGAVVEVESGTSLN